MLVVRKWTAGGVRSGSGTVILKEKWAVKPEFDLCRVTTELSGVFSGGMLSSVQVLGKRKHRTKRRVPKIAYL
ncbi:hypothetical protein E2C01_022366 [Portunus trituberculatus]|uniref:Uncharacterized protein n=1 Tax=Portunus trituberculatus TaxID=210409 RepID=A0A5B7E7H3_PORTR|nr:hypothetical protein [Portunus trituberculatus]